MDMLINSDNLGPKQSFFIKIIKKIYYNRLLNKILAYIYALLLDSYDITRYRQYRVTYNIDPSFKFRGNGIIFAGEGEIQISENSYIAKNTILESFENCKIVIGRNSAIGPYVKMYTGGKSTDQNLDQDPFGGQVDLCVDDISIGNGCWIGANVGIKGGVNIGDNVVIGMNSVVTKDIPSHCIAAGSPAKVVKFKPYLSEKEKLLILNKFNIEL